MMQNRHDIDETVSRHVWITNEEIDQMILKNRHDSDKKDQSM